MKTFAFILITLFPSGTCFIPQPKATQRVPTIATTPTSLLQNKISEITHELEELGQEIKPHMIDHEPHPIGAKDSLVHRLRRELHEKDKLYHDVLDEMERIEHRQTGMKDLKAVMESTLTEIKQQNAMLRHKQNNSKQHEDKLSELLDSIREIHDNLVQANAYAVAWETAEVELWRQEKERNKLEKERESARQLLEKDHESVRKLLWQATKLTGRRVKNLLKRVFFGKSKK